MKRICNPNGERDSTTKELMTILEYCELRNSLCSTLKYLNIANTGVTNSGILLAILHVPDLESLGEYCHIGKALELLQQTVPNMCEHHFQLKCVNSSRTTQHRLELISKRFPQLRKLKITEPMFLPKSLFIIPHSVVSLNLQSVPSTDQWLRSIFEYLSGYQGQTLEELSLRFFPGDILPTVDLNEFLPNCQNLRILNIDGANINWDSEIMTEFTMDYLQKIQLGKIITLNAINKILVLSPALRIIHIYSCSQLAIDEIFNDKLTFKNQNDKLLSRNSQIECFYMYETSSLTKNISEFIINTLPNIKRIGNIRNCVLSSEDIQCMDTWIIQNNFNVKLYAGSHWFSSSCFPL